VLPDAPFLCDIRRAATIAGAPPCTEIAEYLRLHRDRAETALTTLSYLDAALLASRATAPALFSLAMMDDVCPSSTCFAAYHRCGGPKDLRVYEFDGHESGGGHHRREQLAWVRRLLTHHDPDPDPGPGPREPTPLSAPHAPRLAGPPIREEARTCSEESP
jgi:cephalosporin-C deacetylase